MKHLINLHKLLFIINPLSLVLGPFVIGLNLVIQSIIYLISCKSKFTKIIKDRYVIFFIFFCLFLIFSSLNSKYPFYSLESSLFYFRFGIFSLSVAFIVNNFDKSLVIFSYVFNLFFVFLIFDGIYQYIFGYDIFGFVQKGGRLSGPFKEEYILGGVIAKTLPIFLICNYFFLKNYRFKNFAVITVIFLSGITIFLSGERWSSFYFVLYIFLLVITLDYRNFSISRFKIFFNSFIIFILLFLFQHLFLKNNNNYLLIKERLIDFTIQQLNAKNEKYYAENLKELKYTNFSNNIRLFSIEHQAFYEVGIKIFLDHPIIGSGSKSFRKLCEDSKYQVRLKFHTGLIYNGCQTHPHHYYIQLLAETGLIGTLPIIVLFLIFSGKLFLHLSFKYLRSEPTINNYNLILILPLLIIFLPVLPSTNFFSSWNSFFIYFLIGFLIKDRFSYLKL